MTKTRDIRIDVIDESPRAYHVTVRRSDVHDGR
jgi:hypothetical protein